MGSGRHVAVLLVLLLPACTHPIATPEPFAPGRDMLETPRRVVPSLRLQFVIDPDHVLLQIFDFERQLGWWRTRPGRPASRTRPISAAPVRTYSPRYFVSDSRRLETFRRAARARSATHYASLTGLGNSPRDWFWRPGALARVLRATLEPGLDGYLRALKSTPEFRALLEETSARLAFCRQQWDANYPRSLAIMQGMTGLSLDGCFVIYLTYPGLPGGRYLGPIDVPGCDRAISWGGREDFPNYTTVYLWHEILHDHLGRSDVDHAVIQFVTDEELRVRLNGGQYPPYVGHGYLSPLMNRILPSWRAYVNGRGARNLRDFISSLRASGIQP